MIQKNDDQVQNFMKNSKSLLNKEDGWGGGDKTTAKMINTTTTQIQNDQRMNQLGGKSSNFIAKHFKAVESPALMFGSRAQPFESFKENLE